MITLNTSKGLVRIETWDDITSRPGFVAELDPKAHTLEGIIGRYVFKDWVKCGLSNCHTPHAKGYIVVTRDGAETNIGKDCGAKYFGVDFERLSKRFDREMIETENRERLWSFIFRLESVKAQIMEVRAGEHGGDWVYKKSRALVTKHRGCCPEEVVGRVNLMVKQRQGILMRERLASEQEIEDLEAIGNTKLPRPYYIDEPISEIAGISALYPENDLRSILILDLDKRLREIEEIDISALKFDALREWVKWTDSVDIKIESAIEIVINGQMLLKPSNLEPFLQVLPKPEDAKLFRSYLMEIAV